MPGSVSTADLREAVRSLQRAPLRTLLGLTGIMIGIASVITMISTGQIATQEARKEFEALGPDILYIDPSDDRMGSTWRRRLAIDLEDALGLADLGPDHSRGRAQDAVLRRFSSCRQTCGGRPLAGGLGLIRQSQHAAHR